MILLKIETHNDTPDTFDCRISVVEIESASQSELEMLATIGVLTQLAKTEDEGFLTHEQYEEFRAQVKVQYLSMMEALIKQRISEALKDRRN